MSEYHNMHPFRTFRFVCQICREVFCEETKMEDISNLVFFCSKVKKLNVNVAFVFS